MKPNITSVEADKVIFEDGTTAPCDYLSLCTGYRIGLPFLEKSIAKAVMDDKTHVPQLYKNVFSPEIGSSLAFIGFVQPASGGVLTMAETQARWFGQLCDGNLKLPAPMAMLKQMEDETKAVLSRYTASKRHTIQRDPISYNDDLASQFGPKPSIWENPSMAWRLLLSSCGAAQWRLQGPHKNPKAKQMVEKVPVTGLMHYAVAAIVVVLAYWPIRFLFANRSVLVAFVVKCFSLPFSGIKG